MASHYLKGKGVIEASDFETQCLQVMDKVARNGEELVITKKGRPMFSLAPFREQPKSLFGIDKGRIEILGDLITPVDPEWEAKELEAGFGALVGNPSWDGMERLRDGLQPIRLVLDPPSGFQPSIFVVLLPNPTDRDGPPRLAP